MNDYTQDPLWQHFEPLWRDLREISSDIILAGGYGLYLKQQWLKSLDSSSGTKTIIPVDRWIDPAPRVTKDLDFVFGLSVIASPIDQDRLHELLPSHSFIPVPQNARWQFEKIIDEYRKVVLDIHSPSPLDSQQNVTVRSRRIRPNPSMSGIGVHGRENAEAVGTELSPFSFTYDGIEIVLPNTVSYCIMKLVAMHDRQLTSQDASQTPDDRYEAELQAQKHAQDVCKLVALMTKEEYENSTALLEELRRVPAFENARRAFDQLLSAPSSRGVLRVESSWEQADFATIHDVLTRWFG